MAGSAAERECRSVYMCYKHCPAMRPARGDMPDMATISAIAHRWAQEAGKPAPRLIGSSRSNNVYGDSRQLYSYGSHFPLARIVLDSGGNRSWFLLNGDNYSASTRRHQNETRDAVKGTGLDSMIVPFTALREAGIKLDSITPVEILPDREVYTTQIVAALEDVPEYHKPLVGSESHHRGWYDASQREDGQWQYETSRHWLGSAVFTASFRYSGYADPADRDSWREVEGSAYFLSAFDENEPNPLYFLAQLPEGAAPQSYAQALDLLKPMVVADAEASGAEVLRQGDVFAIPTDLTTRQLTAAGGVRTEPNRLGNRHVLGVSHKATEVMTTPAGATYARGIMRHSPLESWRSPEHRAVKLGDRKTWYLLALNTVPAGRSWSMAGNVD